MDGHLSGRQESGLCVDGHLGRNQGCVWIVILVVGTNQGGWSSQWSEGIRAVCGWSSQWSAGIRAVC